MTLNRSSPAILTAFASMSSRNEFDSLSMVARASAVNPLIWRALSKPFTLSTRRGSAVTILATATGRPAEAPPGRPAPTPEDTSALPRGLHCVGHLDTKLFQSLCQILAVGCRLARSFSELRYLLVHQRLMCPLPSHRFLLGSPSPPQRPHHRDDANRHRGSRDHESPIHRLTILGQRCSGVVENVTPDLPMQVSDFLGRAAALLDPGAVRLLEDGESAHVTRVDP